MPEISTAVLVTRRRAYETSERVCALESKTDQNRISLHLPDVALARFVLSLRSIFVRPYSRARASCGGRV